LELRRFWSYHPKFRDIVGHIQGKYSWKERPQRGIVLKNSSGNQFQLAADNFQGTVVSHLHKARVDNFPGIALEWVREDARAIQRNGGLFPSPPGIYFIEITEVAEDCSFFHFHIDPLLDVINESVTMVSATVGVLQAGKFLDGTLRMFQMPGNVPLFEGINYVADTDTGEITLLIPLPEDTYLSADYRWPAATSDESAAVLPDGEPWTGMPNRGLIQPLPGVVLAFGTRIEEGDRMAVVVGHNRSPTAREFGGRWNMTLDFDIMARDVYDQREILDRTALYIWGVLRSRLSTEGIEIETVNLGGESEEIYDENADDYFYNASFSVSIQTDWSIHVPIAATIQRVQPISLSVEQQAASLTPEEAASLESNFKALDGMGLKLSDDPFFGGQTGRNPILPRSSTFEVIR
jgi:hypothetical protein